MPKRPDEQVIERGYESQRIGRAAEAASDRIWTSIGARYEQVRHDVGVDGLVQTQLGSKVDPSRIWVQVKGRAADNVSFDSNDTLSVPVTRTTALRWLRTLDLVVVVLFSVNRENGTYIGDQSWFSIPAEQLNDAELASSSAREVTIRVHRANVFDPQSAARLAWRARVDHAEQALSRLIAEADMLTSVASGIDELIERGLELRQIEPSYLDYLREQRVILLCDLMTDLGILKDERITMEFRQEVYDQVIADVAPDMLGQGAILSSAILMAAAERIRHASYGSRDSFVTLNDIAKVVMIHFEHEMGILETEASLFSTP